MPMHIHTYIAHTNVHPLRRKLLGSLEKEVSCKGFFLYSLKSAVKGARYHAYWPQFKPYNWSSKGGEPTPTTSMALFPLPHPAPSPSVFLSCMHTHTKFAFVLSTLCRKISLIIKLDTSLTVSTWYFCDWWLTWVLICVTSYCLKGKYFNLGRWWEFKIQANG